MNLTLRPYEQRDWDAVLRLWVESWTLVRPEIDFAARAPWLAELFATSLAAGAQIIVAEDARSLLGFVLFDAQRQWLEQIAVSARAQGGGAAHELISCAKSACPQGFGLDVNDDNFRALAFYRREGFVQTGQGKNPRSGLPIVILRWET